MDGVGKASTSSSTRPNKSSPTHPPSLPPSLPPSQVKTILVNIFGGIMRCDVIAAGILSAAKQIGMKKPIVIRLQGTNVDEAQKLIQASGFRMIVEDELGEAATKAVAIANIVKQAGELESALHPYPPSLPPSLMP